MALSDAMCYNAMGWAEPMLICGYYNVFSYPSIQFYLSKFYSKLLLRWYFIVTLSLVDEHNFVKELKTS